MKLVLLHDLMVMRSSSSQELKLLFYSSGHFLRNLEHDLRTVYFDEFSCKYVATVTNTLLITIFDGDFPHSRVYSPLDLSAC